MPREISLVSQQPVTTRDLVAAAADVDGALVPRLLYGGWAVQLVDAQDVAVLTIELSRRVEELFDIERLTGPLSHRGPVWWTEATAPWGPAGEPGVRIAQGLAELLDARLLVADGR